MDNENVQSVPFALHPPAQDRRCTARSKRSGQQCRNWALRGKSKCRFHGGKSRGPTTEAGKEASRSARWVNGDDSLEVLKIREIERVLAGNDRLSQACDIFPNYIRQKIKGMSYAEYRASRSLFSAFCRGDVGLFQLITFLDGEKPKIIKERKSAI